jgi:hypothetical protein
VGGNVSFHGGWKDLNNQNTIQSPKFEDYSSFLDDHLVELEPGFVAILRNSSWLILLSIFVASGEKLAGFSPFFSMEASRASFTWFSFL